MEYLQYAAPFLALANTIAIAVVGVKLAKKPLSEEEIQKRVEAKLKALEADKKPYNPGEL